MSLTKEEFKNKLEEAKIRKIERDIFEELKDSPVRGTAYIEKKYQGSGIDAGKINRWLINYQVKTYGETIAPTGEFEYKTTEEYKKISKKVRINKLKRIRG